MANFPITPSSIIFGLTGALGVVNGFANSVSPALVAKNKAMLGMESTVALHTIGLGAITYGAVYLNAAYRADTTIMWWRIVGRALAVVTFGLYGGVWGNMVWFEAAIGALTAVRLLCDKKGDKLKSA